MNIFFKTGEEYYTGFQKFNILTDRTFRACLIVFFLFIAIQLPGVLIIRPGMNREIFLIVLFLLYVLPAIFIVAGGMPARGWLWYAAAALFFAAATIPPARGASYHFLLFLPASIACMLMVNRIAPGLLAAIGYKSPLKPAMEITFTLLSSAILITFLWLVQNLIRKSGYQFLPADEYVWHAATSALYYGTFWALFHGLMMRRFLDMKYEVSVPIALNTILISIYWVPATLGYKTMSVHFLVGAVLLQAIASQVVIGMTFYYTRSARPLMAIYVIYYLALRTMKL